MYQGIDRRRRSPNLSDPYRLPQLLLAGNAVAAGALGVPLIAAYLGDRSLPSELYTGTQVLACCLFACTGLLCLVGWRLLGYARSAYIGGCFLLFGLLSAPLPLVSVLLPDGGQVDHAAPLARAAISLGALMLAGRTIASTQIVARLNPRRLLSQAASLSLACYCLLLLAWVAVGSAGRTVLHVSIQAAVALSWVAVGSWFANLARRGRLAAWPGCAMLVIGAQAGLRLASMFDPQTWMFPAGTMMLIGAGVALAGSGKGLLDLLRHQDRSLLRLSVDLRASEDQIAGERDRRQEQLHDVRSALAAIRCANGTLHRYAERLDERTTATLEDALTKELARLEGLIDPASSHPLRDFGLEELLAPLVATESSIGSEILLHVGELAVHGRPVDTAAVVQNLLVNARRYAPGSVITIHATRHGDRVRLQIEDSGPGIPERERASVFERGVRGSTSRDVEGTGLGLFVSRRLMAEQHGALLLRSGAAGGACFVLELPAARAATVEGAPEVVEIPDIDDRARSDWPIVRPVVPGQPKHQSGDDLAFAPTRDHGDIET